MNLSNSFSLHFKPPLFNQNEAEIVLGVFGGSDHVDDEAVFASHGEYIDAAGFHGRPGIVWMPASLVECTGVAEAAGSRSQAKRFVISREKNLPLHLGRDFFGIKTSTFEQYCVFI